MKDVTQVEIGDSFVRKTFNLRAKNGGGRDLFKRESVSSMTAARLGIGPTVFEVGKRVIVTERMEPFGKLYERTGLRDRAELGQAIVDKLVIAANHGLHHRDVHIANIVHLDGEPFFVDWELSAQRDPGPSYDLFGPEVSGVEPPSAHVGLDISVWWETAHKGGCSTGSVMFGPLEPFLS